MFHVEPFVMVMIGLKEEFTSKFMNSSLYQFVYLVLVQKYARFARGKADLQTKHPPPALQIEGSVT